jgi:hypothetical protein
MESNRLQRYLVDDSKLDLKEALSLYHVILQWSVNHSDKFIIMIEDGIYENLTTQTELLTLGSAKIIPTKTLLNQDNLILKKVLGLFKSLDTFISVNTENLPQKRIEIKGIPNLLFIQILTKQKAPIKAIAGDLSPVEEIYLFKNDGNIYSLYDYGRTQTLNLTQTELNELSQTLTNSCLSLSYLIPAPSYLI